LGIVLFNYFLIGVSARLIINVPLIIHVLFRFVDLVQRHVAVLEMLLFKDHGVLSLELMFRFSLVFMLLSFFLGVSWFINEEAP